MKNPNQVKVQILKTPSDFTDLLDLQDLITQSAVLKHLQDNQRKYQESFINSFVKTRYEVLSFIPESHWEKYKISKVNRSKTIEGEYRSTSIYIDEKDFENIPRVDYSTSKFDGGFIKFDMSKFLEEFGPEDRFIVDTKRKKILLMFNIEKKHKITVDSNGLTFYYSKNNMRISEKHHYRVIYYNEMDYSFNYVFDLNTNTLKDYKFTYHIDRQSKTHRY